MTACNLTAALRLNIFCEFPGNFLGVSAVNSSPVCRVLGLLICRMRSQQREDERRTDDVAEIGDIEVLISGV